ncbi:MAG: hypothetical protein ACLPKI_06150 [Streptosporangiaceae bacterium]
MLLAIILLLLALVAWQSASTVLSTLLLALLAVAAWRRRTGRYYAAKNLDHPA